MTGHPRRPRSRWPLPGAGNPHVRSTIPAVVTAYPDELRTGPGDADFGNRPRRSDSNIDPRHRRGEGVHDTDDQHERGYPRYRSDNPPNHRTLPRPSSLYHG